MIKISVMHIWIGASCVFTPSLDIDRENQAGYSCFALVFSVKYWSNF